MEASLRHFFWRCAEHVGPELIAGNDPAGGLLDGDAAARRNATLPVDPLDYRLSRNADGVREPRGIPRELTRPDDATGFTAGFVFVGVKSDDIAHVAIVKHCDTVLSSIARTDGIGCNPAMLDDKGKKRRKTPPASEWLAAKITHAIKENPERMSDTELAMRMGLPAESARQTVYGWKKTGRIDKSKIPLLAAVTRRPVLYFLEQDYPDRVIPPGEPVLPEPEVNTREARLLLAFRDLLPDQQDKLLGEAEHVAVNNQNVHQHLQSRQKPAAPEPPSDVTDIHKKPRRAG